MALANQTETSLMFPQLHPKNLAQLKSAVSYFIGKTDSQDKEIRGVWFHGDGNMYTEKRMSDDRKDFHNDHVMNEPAKYRKLFTKSDAIPATLADMEKVLQTAKLKEDSDTRVEATKKTSNDNAFPMLSDDEPALSQQAPPPPPPPIKQVEAPAPVAEATPSAPVAEAIPPVEVKESKAAAKK